MKKFYLKQVLVTSLIILSSAFTFAQQVPNPGFEDWSGAKFDGKIQPKDWYVSNISQKVLGSSINFNLTHQEAGHSGNYSLMVQDTKVGVDGIAEEISPGYFSLGKPWSYLEGLDTKTATAGTSGGINFKYRPDSMSVWIKRIGANVDREDFYLLYYAWHGTAKSSKYKAKNGNCTSVSQTNEESDIRLALDANECGTDQQATQIAEGMWREKKEYGQWTNIRVPIYYFNNDVPTMMNIIFSASNYPNYRANSGLYEGNALYVDDIELIYSSKIQKLYVGGKEWRGFNPNTAEEQTYSLGRTATTIPTIKAVRGAGSLTNAKGETANFSGRELSSSEINITNGAIDGDPTVITVKSEDGKNTSTYKIKFVREASTNAMLAEIAVNNLPIKNFQPALYNYTVELPYGTTTAPIVTAITQEDEQVIEITQANSVTGTASIKVTAADKKTTATYTLQFKVALLADNTLKDIKVNGASIPNFIPSQTSYFISLPTSTTAMPEVEAISAYPTGEQTIVHTKPAIIDGGVYQLSVSTPGNPAPRNYKLNFKLEASTYSKLKSLQMGDGLITDFDPDRTTYYVNLPIGTTELPKVTYEKGESTQNVTVYPGGLDGVTRIVVIAGNGINQTEYKISVTTAKSEVSTLNMIYVGGEQLPSFNPNTKSYTYELPIGTTTLPEITYEKGDEYQTISLLKGGINGTTRITVTAQNGSNTIYQITFSVAKATNATLKMIYLDGKPLEGFEPNKLEYNCPLLKGTTILPVITYDQADQYQTVTVRSGGINGDYRITVRPQSGASQTYVLHFSVATSDNVNLEMIYLGDKALDGFDANKLDYTVTLPIGVSTIPSVTYTKAEDTQKVLSVLTQNIQTITVTAESGKTRIYTITFIIQRSENAFLNMIYLDGKPLAEFNKNTFEYTVTLTGTESPIITVDKEKGQQVTITTPHGVGKAKIVVQPEVGASNTYIIDFIAPANNYALLDMLYVDGKEVNGFKPDVYQYNVECENTNPVITYKSKENQEVDVFMQNETAIIYVTNGNYKAQYSITLSEVVNKNCYLKNILVDGATLTGFKPEQLTYTLDLAAEAAIPEIGFEKMYAKQGVYAGMMNASNYSLLVRAENGDTTRYIIHFNRLLSDDANLINLQLQDINIAFTPTTYEYHVSVAEGYDLPNILVEKRPDQNVALHSLSDIEQQVIVTAASGKTNIYRILYNRQKSSNALLKDILIGGISLKGFETQKFNYTDSLEWRTKVVPCVQPIGAHPDQTITTYHSAIDGITKIQVLAPDGVSTQEYSIYFPVEKSSNVALKFITLDHDSLSITYNEDTTDYCIAVPYNEHNVPLVLYEAQEPEQNIQYISRPLGQTSEIIVTAENGDKRSYKLHFMPTYATGPNQLATLQIEETDIVLDPTKNEHIVVLPYGTRTMTVNYTKQFPEQTIWVQPGGVQSPTVITVKSNRPEEADVVYTITPQVATQDPAILTDIQVNGTTIEGFDPNRFSYIVNVTSSPIVRYTINEGATINVTIQNSKHWQAEITSEGKTNIYNLWYYYPNDILPNGEFTEWTTAKYNGAPKPVGWQVIADADGEYKTSLFGSYKSGSECTKANDDVVYLKTAYVNICARNIPGMMTLGNISGEINTNNSFTISGNIPFHNSPDKLMVRYRAPKVKNNAELKRANRIIYELTGENGYAKIEHNDTEAVNDFTVLTMNLDDINQKVGYPSAMNIILNSYHGEQGGLGTDGMGTVAEMYIDYLRFSYNSTLTGLKVNDSIAHKDGNAFSYTLPDSENTILPTLTFTGEVADQAQLVVWSEETKVDGFGVRNATITNYAEDGTSTEYTLELKRPLDTKNTLSDLRVNGQTISAFIKTKTEYTVHLASTVKHLPDLQPVAASSLQTITTSYADSTMTIVVTPESGEATTYTVRFVTDLSDDVELENITADGITFDAAIKEYTVTGNKLPTITFIKKMDGQTVNLNNGVLHVTAENGAKGTYTIRLDKPVVTTTAQLADIEINGISLQGFNSGTYDYTFAQPNTVAFKRANENDSVVFVQTPQYMQWLVYGTEQHTYRITYPTELSDNTYLKAIYIDSTKYAAFDQQVYDYVYHTNAPVQIHAVANDNADSLYVTYDVKGDSLIYTYTVIAEDGTIGNPYTLAIVPNLSNTPYLQSIFLNGQAISEFRPDSLQYTIVLPTGAYKHVEPTIPTVEYVLGAPRQQVNIEHGILGETTNIIVTSEDGETNAVYEILFEAEPSHCTSLTGIAINGKAIENFESRRHYYSVAVQNQDVQIAWSSNDRFQTVTSSFDGFAYTLHVVAQDGISSSDYVVEIYSAAVSTDMTLKQILLDGLTFDQFEQTINPGLSFSSMQQRYTINLPIGTTYLPEVSARLNSEGQEVIINTHGDTVLIEVTAADGISKNIYTLYFNILKSSNANLKMIYLDGEPLKDFVENNYSYFIDLPYGVVTMPVIFGEPQENNQNVVGTNTGSLQHTITVTAEDGTRRQYLLIFHSTPSQADTLMAIYADGVLIPNFRPDSFYYEYTLPVGTESFPELSWDVADQWQTVTAKNIYENKTTRTTQVQVLAMSGSKNTYTVSYDVMQSTIDTLKMIYIAGKELTEFDAQTTEYSIYLAPKDSVAPAVAWLEGDEYQTVESNLEPYMVADIQIGWKQLVTATAQSGHIRTYTIYFIFSRVLSTNTQLLNIYVNSQPLEGFMPDRYNYTYTVPEGGTLPLVSVEKAEWYQVVDIVRGDTTRITVTAEDTNYYATYTIIFNYQQSPYSYLEGIYQDDVLISGFRPDSFNYDIVLPYGTIEYPKFTYLLGKEGQRVAIDTFVVEIDEQVQTTYRFSVTAPDPMYSSEYDVRVIVAFNDNCRLQTLTIQGEEISGFHADTTDYQLIYPIGTDSTQLMTLEDIAAVAEDTNANVTIYQNGVDFLIQVDAQDGEHSRVYTIKQIITLSNNARLSAIYLNSVPLRDFDPEVTEYIYYVSDAQPVIEAIAEDSMATVEYSMYTVEEPFYIYVTAHDGTERIYTIFFTPTTIQSAKIPSEHDVMIKHIGGLDFAAATLCKNVSIGVYTLEGQLLFYQKLTEMNQNDAVIVTNPDGSDQLLNIYTTTTQFSLPEKNRIFFYVFFENDKNRIKSGKIMVH